MRIGLLGYGKMGRGIFGLLAEAPVESIVFVRDPAKAADFNRKQEKRLRRAASGGAFPESELPQRLAQARFTSDFADLANCDLVIESVTEDLTLKVDLLRRLEDITSPQTVLTTNSSSFSPKKLAAQLRRPERFCGFHFFHPIQLTSVVEIIYGDQVQPDAVELVRQATLTIQRKPIMVKDFSGSAINVIMTGLTVEALYELEQGVALPTRIDAVVGKAARLGPCEAVDAIGVAFFTDVLRRTLEAFPFQLTIPDLLHKLIRDGRDGRTAGGGLFLYRDDRPYDDLPEYYRNPAQTHTPFDTPNNDDALLERIMLQIFYCMFTLIELGIGSLEEFCLGIEDLVGLKADPLKAIRAAGGDKLRADFERLHRTIGPRFDPGPIANALAQIGPPS
jgi:3-hydroxybutyryl-CoA dehydrogenase